MDEGARREVADVVFYWMRRRGMTRQVFADRLGKSVSWVDKIKAGDRQLDRLGVLRDLAAVLGIPLTLLIEPGSTNAERLCPDEAELLAVRRVLRRYDLMTEVFRPLDALPEPDLSALARAVTYGWRAFQNSDYVVVGSVLPGLIRDAQAAVWQLDGERRSEARRSLAWTYQLTASTAFKLGDAELGWLAADRGIHVAEQTEDMTVIGNAARRVVHALSTTLRHDDAVDLARIAIDRLSAHVPNADSSFLSAYGMLLLKGSISAARMHRAADVRDLQREALDIADRLDDRFEDHWSSFGSTNVRIHAVSAQVDMHQGGLAVEAAAALTPPELAAMPKERHAAHLVDLSRSHLQTGDRDRAVETLLDADQTAPGEVRCRSLTRTLVEDLLRSYPRRSSAPGQLVHISRLLGVSA